MKYKNKSWISFLNISYYAICILKTKEINKKILVQEDII